jgi:hypothetical protein
VIPRVVKVIHLVRAPRDVFRSHISADWILNFSPVEEKHSLLGDMCFKYLMNRGLVVQRG